MDIPTISYPPSSTKILGKLSLTSKSTQHGPKSRAQECLRWKRRALKVPPTLRSMSKIFFRSNPFDAQVSHRKLNVYNLFFFFGKELRNVAPGISFYT